MKGNGKSVTVTPKVAGKFSVTCKINKQKGATQDIDVLEAKIVDGFWHDLQGNEISKATWGQKVLYSIGGENLKGENIKAKVIDKDTVSGDDFAADKNFAFGDAAYTNFALQLNKKVRDNTTSTLTPDASLFVKAQIVDIEKIQKEVPAKKGAQQYLNVSSSHNVYRGLTGDSNGKQRHNPVDYDMKSFVYANTTYPKGSKLTVKIFEDKNWAIDPEAKELVNSGVVREDGTLVTTVDWGKLKDAKQNKKTKTYYAKIFDEKDNELFDGSESNTLCDAILIPQSILKKQVGYTGAVLVGSDDVPKIESENGVCECEARVRAFMRMLRVKEDTVGDSGYEKFVGGKSFIKDYGRDWSTHPKISIRIERINNTSNAAGAYQMMGNTYDESKKHRVEYGITDFSKESQDKICLIIMKFNYQKDRPDSFYNTGNSSKDEWRKRFKGQNDDIIKLIIEDKFNHAVLLASLCWASLPDAPYGQQSSTYTNADVKKLYEKYLKEELLGNSDLHLKKGFLKEFDYHCCGEQNPKDDNSNSKCPADCSQCFEYVDVIPNPKINNQSGIKNHNRYLNEQRTRSNGTKYYHTGTDILAVVGTEIHSMMCGTVVHIRKDLPQNDEV